MRSFLVRHRPSRSMLVALMAVFLALGGARAYGAAVNFLLNTANTSTAQTSLDGSAVAGRASLKLVNTNAATGSTPLNLTTASGHAPLTVSAGAGRVANLNADKLDGLDSSRLQQRVSAACSSGSAIAGIAASGAPSCVGLRVIAGDESVNGPFDGSTPLQTFTTSGVSPVLVFFDVSAFASTVPADLGAGLYICPTGSCPDGLMQLALATVHVGASEGLIHKALVSGWNYVGLPAGTYDVVVVPFAGTSTDSADVASWSLVSLG